MPRPLLFLALLLFVPTLSLATLVSLGGPGQPEPLSSVSRPFADLDLSDLPAPQQYRARDGAQLSYAAYPAARSLTSVVLIHGSSANLRSLHPLARHLRDAGYSVYSLDVRGHGESGERGHIAYIGQLEDDLDDFLTQVNPAGPRLLVGFSAGGGFALRYATSSRQKNFAGYLLLAPFVHHEAPNARPDSGGWVSVGLPRIIGLAALNGLGIEQYNRLPVMHFAVSAEDARRLTPDYDYNLTFNFRGPERYPDDLRALRQPTAVVAGSADEIFVSEALDEIFSASPQPVPVTLVPQLDHVGLTLAPSGHAAITRALGQLH